jgi:hypothetical protein
LDVSHHPYRLVTGRAPYRLAEALRTTAADPPSGALAPFPATAGVLSALVGLPSLEVPGLRVVDAGRFDLTSETGPPPEAAPAPPIRWARSARWAQLARQVLTGRLGRRRVR